MIEKVSRPYIDAGSLTIYWNEFEYDVLGRVRTETLPDEGSGTIVTTTKYLSGNLSAPIPYSSEIETTNDKGHITRQLFNVRGDSIAVIDAYGTSDEVTTEYAYDAFGNLTSVIVDDNAATEIVNTYDDLGRKVAMDDPDMGSWTYEYNSFGEVQKQTDAKSQVTTFEYDDLGRMVTRTEAGSDTTTWLYDTAANGIGRLAEVTGPEGETKVYTYDSLGRPATTKTIIGTDEYVTGQEFDSDGRISKITYPASTAYPLGLRVRYDFNSRGYLHEVRNDDTSNELYWRLNEQTTTVTDVTFGNLVDTTFSYVPETGLLHRIRSTSNPSQPFDVQDLEYAFDALGNLTERIDHNRGVSEKSGLYGGSNDSYDALGRLTRIERFTGTTSEGATTLAYDALGNLTSKTGVGSYTYTGGGCGGGVHAAKSAGSQSLCYDANGNLTQGYNFTAGRARTVTWTPFNKPATITEAGQTIAFDYAGDRTRFRQVNAFTGVTTIYVEGLYEKETVSGVDTHVHYIYAAGEAVAIYKSHEDTSEETVYLHRDHLGSVAEITDASGAVVESFAYDAFGKRREASDWEEPTGQIFPAETPRGYTGHEHLDDVGLVHMNGRVYDPDLGRMLSSDPYVQFPTFSQSYNRYAYVLNNPLSHTDPSGFCVAAGPACPASGFGGFVGGLGAGSLGGMSRPPIRTSGFSIALTHVTTWFFSGAFNLPYTSALGGQNCFMPGCGPGIHLDGDEGRLESGGLDGGLGLSMSPWFGFAQTTYVTLVQWFTGPILSPNNRETGIGNHATYFARPAGGAYSPVLVQTGNQSTRPELADSLPKQADRLLQDPEFVKQFRLTQIAVGQLVRDRAMNPRDPFAGVDPRKLWPAGGIIRESRILGVRTGRYHMDRDNIGDYVANGNQRYIGPLGRFIGETNFGALEPIANAAAVVIVVPAGNPRIAGPDFEGIRRTFAQLDRVTPVFVTYGGTTYVLEGEHGPREVSY